MVSMCRLYYFTLKARRRRARTFTFYIKVTLQKAELFCMPDAYTLPFAEYSAENDSRSAEFSRILIANIRDKESVAFLHNLNLTKFHGDDPGRPSAKRHLHGTLEIIISLKVKAMKRVNSQWIPSPEPVFPQI